MSTTETTRFQGVAANTALVVLAILLCLGLLEVGARLTSNFLGVAPYIAFDPTLGWSPAPNATKIHKKPGNFEATYHINSQGYRGRLHSAKPKAGTFRIVLLGDSFGFGWGVDDHHTYAARLEEILEGVEVINLSVSGYGTDQELLRLQRDGLPLNPDLVIIHVVSNDFLENRRPFMYQRAKPYFLQDAQGNLTLHNVPVDTDNMVARHYYRDNLPLPFREWLSWNSYAYTFFNRRYREFMSRVRPATTGDPTESGDTTPADQAWPLFKALVGEIQGELEENGIRGLVMHHYLQGLKFTPQMAELPLPSFDLHQLLYVKHTKREVSFPNDGHWSPVGHELVANALAEELIRRGLVTAKNR